MMNKSNNQRSRRSKRIMNLRRMRTTSKKMMIKKIPGDSLRSLRRNLMSKRESTRSALIRRSLEDPREAEEIIKKIMMIEKIRETKKT
jgi:hypothetical protein